MIRNIKKLSRSERKFWFRQLHKAKRTISKYEYSNTFTNCVTSEQKAAYKAAVPMWSRAKKMLGR